MIELNNISVSFDDKKVIDKLSFKFLDGINYAIMGESGCGKTTLMNVIAGTVKGFEGFVNTNGARISYVFQDPRLYDWLTVSENVSIVSSLPLVHAKKRAEYILETLGLEDATELHPSELSGGMRQRVSIARAIAYDPDVMLIDEPFRALDEETRVKVAKYLFDFMKEKTVIMVTHDVNDTFYADQILTVATTPLRELAMAKSVNP